MPVYEGGGGVPQHPNQAPEFEEICNKQRDLYIKLLCTNPAPHQQMLSSASIGQKHTGEIPSCRSMSKKHSTSSLSCSLVVI